MHLWSKDFEPDKLIERFTVGRDRELDMELAPYDVQGSKAHIAMLNSIGLLADDELATLTAGLDRIAAMIDAGEFAIADGVEDVHSQVEFLLTEWYGDMGKKIHSGRSRNDQVLVDLKLLFRDRIKRTAGGIRTLFDTLQTLSDRYADVLMPGYTHLQVATPSSFGLWFGAYAESLADDMRMLVAAYGVADQNPLGSAAGYGSSFPLNREMTTELLGFGTLHYNSIAAQMSRGKTERACAAAIAVTAGTLAHLSMDVCMYMCQNFGFISFPDELTTGSSIMPHKKNPDVFELIRGKCNRLQTVPQEVSMLTANLPLGYNRDLQLLKEIMLPAFDTLDDCLALASYMLERIKVRRDILDDPRYSYLFTVESVNALVLGGMPFREAYRTVGMQVQHGTYTPPAEHTPEALHHTHTGSLGNLANDRIRAKFAAIAAPLL